MDVTWCDQKFHHVWLFLAAILTPKNRSLRTESETVKTCLTEFSRSYFRICVLSLLDRVVLILVDWTTISVGKHKGTQMGWFTTRPLVWSPAINDGWPTQISPCLSFGLRLVKSDRFSTEIPSMIIFLGKARNQNGIFDEFPHVSDENVLIHRQESCKIGLPYLIIHFWCSDFP